MAEKIEIEKPVVSKELAERFEMVKDAEIIPSTVCQSEKYAGEIPETFQLTDLSFEILLAKMYVVGYEVEKLKRYLLKLPVPDNDRAIGYIIRDDDGRPRYQWLAKSIGASDYFGGSRGFTKAEIEADEGLKKLASVCELVEVED